jgi:hypothetical protein
MRLAILALVLAMPSAQPPEPHWRVHVVASGNYAVDYGGEHDVIDGAGAGTWSWELKAVATGDAIDTDTAIFRMTTAESSSIVLPGGMPYCRPPAGSDTGWVRDERIGLHFSARRRGFQIDHPFYNLLKGCHAGAHGMTLYDGADPAIARVRRGAFRPRRARSFERTWTQSIVLDRSHDPGQDTHTFTVNGTLAIELRRISTRAAGTRAARLKRAAR